MNPLHGSVIDQLFSGLVQLEGNLISDVFAAKIIKLMFWYGASKSEDMVKIWWWKELPFEFGFSCIFFIFTLRGRRGKNYRVIYVML